MKSPNRVNPLSGKGRQHRAAESIAGAFGAPPSGPSAAPGPVAVKDPPEIVSDRVLRLRASIANGTYQVSSLHVADKLIEHMLRRGSQVGAELEGELEMEPGSELEASPDIGSDRDPRKPRRRG